MAPVLIQRVSQPVKGDDHFPTVVGVIAFFILVAFFFIFVVVFLAFVAVATLAAFGAAANAGTEATPASASAATAVVARRRVILVEFIGVPFRSQRPICRCDGITVDDEPVPTLKSAEEA
jgi:hypothetical protein